MIFRELIQNGQKLATTHAPALLTAFGAVGVASTAVLAGRAAYASHDRILTERLSRVPEDTESDEITLEPLNRSETVRLVWPLYIPAATTGAFTVAAIILAHRVNSKRAAVMVAAYALNEGKLEEYKNKVEEVFGEKKAQELSDNLVQDRVNSQYKEGEVIFSPLDGKIMIRDEYSGRFFWSTREVVDRAVNEINAEIIQNDYCTLTDFYSLVDLSPVSTSDHFGWNTNERCEINWTTCTTPDGNTPVHSFDFVNPPIMDPGDRRSFR